MLIMHKLAHSCVINTFRHVIRNQRHNSHNLGILQQNSMLRLSCKLPIVFTVHLPIVFTVHLPIVFTVHLPVVFPVSSL